MRRRPARTTFAAAIVAAGALAVLPAGAQEAPTEEQLALGNALFTGEAEPACGICHTLAHAGTEGAIGPILDDLKPEYARVKAAVTQGVGLMPAYVETLTPEEIHSVSIYVSHKTNQ